MNELENIRKQIEEAEKRQSEVKLELRDIRAQFEEKRKEQSAIINSDKTSDKDAEEIRNEIISLMTLINNTEEAHKQLIVTLRELQQQKIKVVRAIAFDQAQQDKVEILAIEADIYHSLFQAANRLPELSKKRADYVNQLVMAGSMEARDEGQKITYLYDSLRREIPDLLDKFPRTILADGSLPVPNLVRSMIRNS